MADTDPNTPRGVIIKRPQTTIYTSLLGVAALAMTIGVVLLLLETFQFGGPFSILSGPQ